MEMEHINENTVLIRVANQDLIDRGVSLVDLFTNPTRVEPFFHGLLEELDLLDFFNESEALTFQVMPNSEGLEIYVSESMQLKPTTDTSLENSEISDNVMKQLSEFFDENGVNVQELVENSIKEMKESSEEDDEETGEEYELENDELAKDIEKTLVFNEFEDFISLSKQLKNETLESSLCEYNDRYFLSIKISKNNPRKKAILAISLEYGEQSHIGKLVLQEYGNVVMPHSALETARNFFR